MKTHLNIFLALFLFVLLVNISGCQGDDSSGSSSAATTDATTDAEEETYSIDGYVQKGPFVSGSAITIQSLSNKLESTGTSYQTTITDDFGTFSMGKKIKGKYVEIIATGFYFDEVAGELSAANYTLRAVADLSSKESVNVNVLTTLEKDRIIYLMTEGGKSFSEAKTQAETEILAVFNISESNASSFDGMNISEEGDSNAILLAISATLQANNSVAQLSELISKINLDIKADGTLDNESYKSELKANAENLDLSAVRSNLVTRYSNLGLTVTIADFEKYAKNLVPGYVVSSLSGNTDETGRTSTFTIRLKSPPESDVLISITSSDTSEGTVSPSTITFTQNNYDTAQTVTITGVDDTDRDGNITYSINMGSNTSDSNYNGVSITSVSVTNSDDEGWNQVTASAGWSARFMHSSVVFDNKIWVLGGAGGPYVNDVWYSTDGTNWTQATASAAWSVRRGHSSVVFDNKIWVLGGQNGVTLTNDVWYSSNGVTWTQATASAAWSARSYHSSVVYDSKMWVLGGYSASKNDVWSSSDGVTWTQATASAAWGVRYMLLSVVYDSKMWVISGVNGGSEGGIDDAWYSTDGVTWTQATASAAWGGRYASTSVVFDNKIWLMGGNYSSTNSVKNDVWYYK